MDNVIKYVIKYTVKYFIVLIAGLVAGHFNNIFIHILLEKKSFLQGWRHWLSHRPKGMAVEIKRMLVVVITAAVFILLFIKYRLTADFVFFAYLLSILVIMVFVDIETKTISNGLVLAGLAGSIAAFIYNMFLPLKIYGGEEWWEPLLGLLPGSGLLFLIALLGAIVYKNDEVMGMGDVKIFAPVGVFLGWKMCAMALIISMFLGGLTSILLIILRIKKRKDTIPFGPFIAVATFIVIMWGQDIWSWYFSRL